MGVLNFHPRFIHWVKESLTKPMYSVMNNRVAEGFFAGERGVRKRDPLSPYLFVLSMEVFSQLLTRAVGDG